MKTWILFVTLVVLTLVALPEPGRAQAKAAAASLLGARAPDFKLVDLDGGVQSLSDYQGRITVVSFLATKCPISNQYTARIRTLAEDFANKGVAFLAINSNSDESIGMIRAHAEKNGFEFPILKDENSAVADLYGAVRTPEVYVVDSKGILRYHGRIDNSRVAAGVRRSDLREAVNELLAGKDVSVSETKSFGCLIVRAQAAVGKKVGASRPIAESTPNIGLIKPVAYVRQLEETKGKVLVVNFWATWCGPCVAEFPEFVALDGKYRDLGVRFVGISADDVSDLQLKVVPFVKERKVKFDIFIQDVEDPQEMIDVVDKKWEGVLPTTFVYDRQGKLVFTRFGIIDRDQLIQAIENALKS